MTDTYRSLLGPVASPDFALPLPHSGQRAIYRVEAGEVVTPKSEVTSRRLHEDPVTGRFEVDMQTRTIRAAPYANADVALAMHVLVDDVFPRIADLDGHGLHASAVVLNGGAYLFVGPSGAGKSTLAARLARRHAELLADDSAAIVGGFVQPTYRPSRIREASIGLLGLEKPGEPDVTGKIELTQGHQIRLATSAAPLVQVGVIGNRFRELSIGEAVQALGPQQLTFEPRDRRRSLHKTIDLVQRHGPIVEVPRDWDGPSAGG